MKQIDIFIVIERFLRQNPIGDVYRVNKGLYYITLKGERIEISIKHKALYFLMYSRFRRYETPALEKEFCEFLKELKKEYSLPKEVNDYLKRRRLELLFT